jgi:hypothetical protein
MTVSASVDAGWCGSRVRTKPIDHVILPEMKVEEGDLAVVGPRFLTDEAHRAAVARR